MEILDTPPSSFDIETSLLVSALVDQDFDAWDIIKPEYFYNRRHMAIFAGMLNLHKRNEPIEVALLCSEIKADPDMKHHLSEILENPPTVSVKSYAQKLKQYWQIRQFLMVGVAVQKKCFDILPDDVDEIETFISNEIDRIGAGCSGGWTHIQDIMIECVEQAEELNKRGGITGVPSGYKDLDFFTCGFHSGDLVIIAGRPGMGKTAFGCNTLANAAFKGFKGGLISLEMVRGQVGNRFLAMDSMIDALKFRSGRFSNEDWDHLHASASNLSRFGLWVDDAPRASYQDCERKIRELVRHHGGQIAVIDYLGFMDGDKSSNKVAEIQSITRALKAQAKEFKIPIILICQLSRECEKRPNKRPILSDLRDSGAIEQDADMVLFLYRDDYYQQNSKDSGIVEVSIAKQRNGPTGTIKLQWQERFTRFNNLERV